MWASWLIQPGQRLTTGPEQNFARRAVTNCVEPKEWRIVGHNESEGMKLRNREQSHWARVSTSLKPVSLHALIGECDSDIHQALRGIGRHDEGRVPCIPPTGKEGLVPRSGTRL